MRLSSRQNEKCKPEIRKSFYRMYNRDTNAAWNMLKIIRKLIKDGERPEEYKGNN
jgi:hypothetical protein